MKSNGPLNNCIETNRLKLEPFTNKYAHFLLTLLNTKSFIKFIGDRGVRSTEQAERYIKEKMEPQYLESGFTNNVVIEKRDNKPIGMCGLFNREGVEGFDIGFAFLPEQEGKGVGYESALALLNTAKLDDRVTKISAITSPENIKSQNLIKKLGLVFLKEVHIHNVEDAVWLYEMKL